MKSAKEHVNALRTAPEQWMDTAIVVVFHDRFEFVREDCPDPSTLLDSFESRGGVAIGLVGVRPDAFRKSAFLSKVFPEYEGQAWPHRHMDRLRQIVRDGGSLA